LPPVVLVLNGHFTMGRTTADGRQLTTDILDRGRLVGLLAMRGRPATVEVQAITDGRIAAWAGDTVRSLVAHDAGFALDVLDVSLQALEAVGPRLEALLYQDARGRVARVLLSHAQLFFGTPAVLNRSHLPGLVGTSREMTGRVLRELEAENIVQRTARGWLELRDRIGLEAIAAR
jgi:CRP-like cAMP-binding protein